MSKKIYDAIRALLAEHGEQIARPGEAWHCTELTGYATGRASALPGWFREGTPWWRDMNIWNASDPWSPLRAAGEVARELGTKFTDVVGPISPRELDELEPGLYIVQGWRVLPNVGQGEVGDGHAFFVEALNEFDAQGFQLGRVIESSKKHGLRVSGQQWRGGSLPAPQRIEARVERYVAGVGFSPLWRDEPQATGSVERAAQPVPTTPEPTEEQEGDMPKIDIDPAERDDILETATSEWQELIEQIKAGTLTPGAVVEAGLDLVIAIALAVIPGELDNMAYSLFKGQIDLAKGLLAKAIDTAVGVNVDAIALLQRAEKRREDADAHLLKALEKEAVGKTGGLFSKSPEKHRQRAAELIALAEQDEAAAAALQAGE